MEGPPGAFHLGRSRGLFGAQPGRAADPGGPWRRRPRSQDWFGTAITVDQSAIVEKW